MKESMPNKRLPSQIKNRCTCGLFLGRGKTHVYRRCETCGRCLAAVNPYSVCGECKAKDLPCSTPYRDFLLESRGK